MWPIIIVVEQVSACPELIHYREIKQQVMKYIVGVGTTAFAFVLWYNLAVNKFVGEI